MVDHQAMRDAMNRAINYEYTQFCNDCKTPYIPETGYETTIYDGIASYTLWYCKDCQGKHEI